MITLFNSLIRFNWIDKHRQPTPFYKWCENKESSSNNNNH